MLRRVRAVDCWCGYLVQGENDEEVETRLRAHVSGQHADEKRSDEDVRAGIADRGYEPPTGDPPWAY